MSAVMMPGQRRRRGIRAAKLVTPAVGVAITVAIWIIGGNAGWGSGMVVTPAEAVRPILGSSRNVYARATAATAWSAARGLAVGGSLAFVAALLATTMPSLRRGISRLAAIANAAPWVAVAPCLLVILGRERGPFAVAAIAVFFFVFVSTSVGLAAAPRSTHDVFTAFGAPRRFRLMSLQLPGCWPSVVDGLKLAAPASLAGAIFGEWYGASRGLGVLLITAMQGGRAERLWAASLLSAACGLLSFATLAGVRQLLVRRYGTTIARPPELVRKRRHPLTTIAIELSTLLVLTSALVTAWYMWIEIKDISPLVVARPSRVWRDLTSSFGDYVSASVATLSTAAAAFVIGAFVGLAAAVLASRSKLMAGVAVPVIVVLAATPLVALFPLFARVLGYNPSTIRALAATMVFFPVFVFTRSGMTAATRPALDVVDALGGSANARFRLLILPAAVPHIVSGCRIAAGSAVIAAVVGESLIGREGLGVEFSRAYRRIDELPRAFGAAIVIVIVSVTVFAAAGAIERVVHSRWT